MRWIESEGLSGNDESDDLVGDLFADPDPIDTFHFDFNSGKIHITLQGHKAENGQTLHSTGLTLWRASPLLCEYMVSEQDCIRERTVLEVGSS